jgi:serine/threonine protein kinase
MEAPATLVLTTETSPDTLLHTRRIVGCLYDNSANVSSLGPVSVITLCLDEIDKRHYVLKKSSKLDRLHDYMVEEVRNEAALIGRNVLAHPNIVRGLFAFETEHNVYLGMEFASGGTLLDYFVEQRRTRLGEGEVFWACRRLFSAVEFVHSAGYVHCDIKPENVLLMGRYPRIDQTSVLKLADFGYCKSLKNLPDRRTGSPEYAAPEMWRAGNTNTERTDVWACGVVFYILCYGEMPFGMQPEDVHTGKTEEQVVISRIAQCHPYRLVRPFNHRERASPSASAMDLIRLMLEKNAACRPSMAECNAHDFITGRRRPAPGALVQHQVVKTKSCAAESATVIGESAPVALKTQTPNTRSRLSG